MKKISYVDMDDVLTDYSTSYKTKLLKETTIPYPQSQVGFFLNLLPIKVSIESVNKLNRDARFDIYVFAAPMRYFQYLSE